MSQILASARPARRAPRSRAAAERGAAEPAAQKPASPEQTAPEPTAPEPAAAQRAAGKRVVAESVTDAAQRAEPAYRPIALGIGPDPGGGRHRGPGVGVPPHRKSSTLAPWWAMAAPRAQGCPSQGKFYYQPLPKDPSMPGRSNLFVGDCCASPDS